GTSAPPNDSPVSRRGHDQILTVGSPAAAYRAVGRNPASRPECPRTSLRWALGDSIGQCRDDASTLAPPRAPPAAPAPPPAPPPPAHPRATPAALPILPGQPSLPIRRRAHPGTDRPLSPGPAARFSPLLPPAHELSSSSSLRPPAPPGG